MPEQESDEELRPGERALALAPRVLAVARGARARPEVPRRLEGEASQMNWRAGYLLCLGTAIGYSGAAWIETVAGRL